MIYKIWEKPSAKRCNSLSEEAVTKWILNTANAEGEHRIDFKAVMEFEGELFPKSSPRSKKDVISCSQGKIKT